LEVDVVAANYLFRAVPIPAGEHTVELRYESRALTTGLAISALSGTIVLLALVWATVHRRTPRSGV
jgi:uncharacterized membrane protein YfhO